MEKVYKNIRIRDRSCKIQSLGGKRIQELFSLHSLNFRSFVDEYNRCSIFRNVLGRNVDVDRLCAKRTSEGRGKENRYLAVEGIGRHICSPRNEGSLTCRQTTRRAFRFPLSLSLSLRCLLPALRCRVFYFVEEISIVTEVLRVSSSPSVDCVAPFSPLRAESLLFFLPSFPSFSFPFYLHLDEIQRNGWKIDRESRSPSSSLVRVELAIIRKRSLLGGRKKNSLCREERATWVLFSSIVDDVTRFEQRERENPDRLS